MSFSVTTSDPELSREMADAAAEAFSIEMASILKFDAIKKLDTASTGQRSFNAGVEAWKDRIKFMLLGFVLACLFVSGLEVFDNKVRTIRDASIGNQLPVIGIIPCYKEQRR
jgi:capsular polysaccharide biosynthesis protein